MKRIVFVGAAGSGKSTLASAVYATLKAKGYNAEQVFEWIRYDINGHGAMTSIWEQYRTRQYQKELEDAVPAGAEYVICDSGTLMPYFYACLYSNPSEPRQRLVLQDMHKYLLDDLYLKRYTMIFYLPSLIPMVQDGTRYQTDVEVKLLNDHMHMVFTKVHRLSNIEVIDVGFAERLTVVMQKITTID